LSYISLLFHRIEKVQAHELIDITRGLFEGCIDLVIKKNIPVRNLEQPFEGKMDEYVSLTFDDGWESDYTIAFPVLKKYNINATFFITTGWIDQKGFLKASWIKEMSDSGMEIGSHTVTHPYLTELSKKKVYDEFRTSKNVLEDMLGREITGVSIPGGAYNRKIIEIAQEVGYKYVATSSPGVNKKKGGIVARFSIHNLTSLNDINKLLNRSPIYLYKINTNYKIRELIKKGIGLRNYEVLRNKLIKIK